MTDNYCLACNVIVSDVVTNFHRSRVAEVAGAGAGSINKEACKTCYH